MTASHWAKIAKQGKSLRERHPFDFYPTPRSHIEMGLSPYAQLNPEWVLDIGAGEGAWGRVARELWQESYIVGVEPRLEVPFLAAPYSLNVRADFLGMTGESPYFDFIMANPPYAISEKIIRKAFCLLKDGGVMVMLFRLQFLASLTRYGFWSREFPPVEVVVCSDRPSFTGNNKTDSDDYMLVHWRKGYRGITQLKWGIADEAKRAKYEQSQLELFL